MRREEQMMWHIIIASTFGSGVDFTPPSHAAVAYGLACPNAPGAAAGSQLRGPGTAPPRPACARPSRGVAGLAEASSSRQAPAQDAHAAQPGPNQPLGAMGTRTAPIRLPSLTLLRSPLFSASARHQHAPRRPQTAYTLSPSQPSAPSRIPPSAQLGQAEAVTAGADQLEGLPSPPEDGPPATPSSAQRHPRPTLTMSDPNRSHRQAPLPPPAPPLPPTRPGAWQRVVGQLGFGQTPQSRPPSPQAHRPSSAGRRADAVRTNRYPPLPSGTAAHKTTIPIAALDINGEKTHAVLAGHEILKTIHVEHSKVTEDVNLRSTLNTFTNSDLTSGRRQFLPAADVKWSHGTYSHIIATAAVNGPIVLYNVTRGSELASFREHRTQVHKLAFNPHWEQILLSGCQDGTIKMWDFRDTFSNDGKPGSTMKSSKQFTGRAGGVRDVRWSPTDAMYFVTGSDNGVIQKWDVRIPSGPVLRITGHQKPCYSVDWHPDGRHVVSGGFDKYVRVWDFQNGKNKQKATFQLKTPHAIMNIRWRPACWSAELAGTGHWQSTQLITSYAQDDPRLHVWDLRRPHLPFRELDRYNTPATDLLWASKDMLWTVGNEGMFTQTDISFAPLVQNELAPCAMHWSPDGEFVTFAEDRAQRRESALDDPAVGFLSVRHEKLSSGEDGAYSRSLTDDDAIADGRSTDGRLTNSFKRRQSKTASTRSTKSQASTPPSTDGFPPVLSLEKAVFERDDLFNNKQVGVGGNIFGVTAESEVVEFLANRYPQAATESERRAHPGRILQQLEEAFEMNAEACDLVSMHRTAQSWRILGAVIVPELRQWADKNREERLKLAPSKNPSPKQGGERHGSLRGRGNENSSPMSAKQAARSQKVISNLFKGVWEAGKHDPGQEMDSTSSMTTPLARPLPDSPLSVTAQSSQRFQNLDETMEAMPPLPPSVLISHSAAAMASRALLGAPSNEPETPPSSPETKRDEDSSRKRHRRTHTSDSLHSARDSVPISKALPQPIQAPVSGSASRKQRNLNPQRQEDRRAALRDYRGQARPVLNYDDALNSPRGTPYGQRYDSAGSFPMFSASTDSSHKATSMGGSLNSPDLRSRTPATPDEWNRSQDDVDFLPSSPPSDESGKQNPLSRRFEVSDNSTLSSHDMASATGLDFSLDGKSESFEVGTNVVLADNERKSKGGDYLPYESSSISSSPEEPFPFEVSHSIHAPQVHSFNPLRSHSIPEDVPTQLDPTPCPDASSLVQEDMKSPDYIYGDFRPIDLSRYEPKLPFAWSSLPLICHAIAFDSSTGPACGQFSAYLLMHVYPYFFHHSFAHVGKSHGTKQSVAERLMVPSSGHRIVESILLNHCSYLRKMSFFVPLAELRQVCTDFDYPSLYDDGYVKKKKGDRLNDGDLYFLSANCSNCHAPMTEGKNVCGRCRSVRGVCPICRSLHPPEAAVSAEMMKEVDEMSSQHQHAKPGGWTVCHTCGHGAHFSCMVEWLSHPYSHGACPSQGCGCDCGPGPVRKQRIEKQMFENEMRLLQETNVPMLKKDAKKADASPAVQKTRHLLRDGERGTQSGDERGTFARRGNGGKSGFGGHSSQKKSVRLVTPGEEEAGG